MTSLTSQFMNSLHYSTHFSPFISHKQTKVFLTIINLTLLTGWCLLLLYESHFTDVYSHVLETHANSLYVHHTLQLLTCTSMHTWFIVHVPRASIPAFQLIALCARPVHLCLPYLSNSDFSLAVSNICLGEIRSIFLLHTLPMDNLTHYTLQKVFEFCFSFNFYCHFACSRLCLQYCLFYTINLIQQENILTPRIKIYPSSFFMYGDMSSTSSAVFTR